MNNELTAALLTIEKCRELSGCPAGVDLQDWVKQLAAENVAMKDGVAEEIEVINRGGQMYCVKDGMSINPIYARGWNDHRANVTAVKTPATDRIVAEAEARGIEKFAAHLRANDNGASVCKMIALGADDFAKQLREGAK